MTLPPLAHVVLGLAFVALVLCLAVAHWHWRAR